MRYSSWTNSLLIFLDPHDVLPDSIYGDEWSEDERLLFYRGSGQVGDQDLHRKVNRRLTESHEQQIRILRSETIESGRHAFRGEMTLADVPWYVQEPDKNGNTRRVCVFPLAFLSPGVRLASNLRKVTRASATTPAGRAPSSADCVIDNTPAAAAEVLAEMGTGAGFNLRMQGADRPSQPFEDRHGNAMLKSTSVLADMSVLWLKGNRLQCAFDVVSQSSLDAFLFRAADLTALREGAEGCIYAVGTSEVLLRVSAQLERPSLMALPFDMRHSFRVIDEADVTELLATCGSVLSSLSLDSILQDRQRARLTRIPNRAMRGLPGRAAPGRLSELRPRHPRARPLPAARQLPRAAALRA